MPTFDKPNQEMPERIWAYRDAINYTGWDTFRNPKWSGINSAYLRSDLALPRDKVRELVEQFYKVRDSAYLSHSHKEELEKFYNMIAALFPGGVEEEG